MKDRSLGAIFLGSTGNVQGTYVFLSLKTGQRITRTSWTELPITDTVINRGIALGEHEKAQAGLKINNSQGNIEEQYNTPEDVNIVEV